MTEHKAIQYFERKFKNSRFTTANDKEALNAIKKAYESRLDNNLEVNKFGFALFVHTFIKCMDSGLYSPETALQSMHDLNRYSLEELFVKYQNKAGEWRFNKILQENRPDYDPEKHFLNYADADKEIIKSLDNELQEALNWRPRLDVVIDFLKTEFNRLIKTQ